MKTTRLCLFFISILTGSGLAHASDIEDLTLLKQELEDYVTTTLELENVKQHQLKVQVGTIDPRLRLQKCPVRVLFEFTHNSERPSNTIKASCPEGDNWNIYVPIRVSRYKEIIVAAQMIPKGKRLTKNMLAKKLVNISQIHGQTFEQMEPMLGATTKRSMQAGQVLSSTLFCVVCQGDSVDIVAGNETFQVKMAGEAITDGQHGDRIRVRNTSSNKVIEAEIEQSGVVKIKI